MHLGISPHAISYIEQLAEYGVAYDRGMDMLDFMHPHKPETWSWTDRVLNDRVPFAVGLWLSFDLTEIVGVKFEQPIAFSLKMKRFVPDNPHTFMEWVDEYLQDWSFGGSKVFSAKEEQVVRALDIHAKARAFIRTHLSSTAIPAPVHQMMAEDWQRRGNMPPSSTH